MKNNKGPGNKQNINRSSDKKNMSGAPNRKRAEIRDNLDHREGLENDNKGSNVTHNEKDIHKGKKDH